PFTKTIVSNLSIAGGPIDRQVLLRVKFAQLDRSRLAQYGINLMALTGQQTVIGSTTGQFGPPGIDSKIGLGQQPNGAQPEITRPLNVFGINPVRSLAATIQALQSENILEILAEPNLVTSNGHEASFLVGGEFPIPVLQGGANAGAVTVQFREF